MSAEIRYTVRYFDHDGNYIYSVNCTADILDDVLKIDNGYKIKVYAYKVDSESED